MAKFKRSLDDVAATPPVADGGLSEPEGIPSAPLPPSCLFVAACAVLGLDPDSIYRYERRPDDLKLELADGRSFCLPISRVRA